MILKILKDVPFQKFSFIFALHILTELHNL